MAAEGESPLSKWDLLPKMVAYYDRHLLFPLIDRNDDQDTKVAKRALFMETGMIDFVSTIDQEIRGLDKPAPEWEKKREEVMAKRQALEEAAAPVLAALDNEEAMSNLRQDKGANLEYLKGFGVTQESLAALYDYGYWFYNTGEYAAAAETLQRFRLLSNDGEKIASASWGRLACQILSTEWNEAVSEINQIKETYIDAKLFNNPLSQLQARAWLVHWALFPYFNHEPVRDTLTEIFFSPAYINTITAICPWILRYLTASVITNRNRTRNSNAYQKQLKDIVRIVKLEGYEYHDPLTDFVKALYIDFDFEDAQKKLIEAESLFHEDFFLGGSREEFMESARHLISESYCKIHQRIDIKDLSTRLGLDQDEGEKWIVNLIRDTRVDAKMDYQAGTVVMNHPPQSVYQQVIERTKGGFFRTQVLSAAVGK